MRVAPFTKYVALAPSTTCVAVSVVQAAGRRGACSSELHVLPTSFKGNRFYRYTVLFAVPRLNVTPFSVTLIAFEVDGPALGGAAEGG